MLALFFCFDALADDDFVVDFEDAEFFIVFFFITVFFTAPFAAGFFLVVALFLGDTLFLEGAIFLVEPVFLVEVAFLADFNLAGALLLAVRVFEDEGFFVIFLLLSCFIKGNYRYDVKISRQEVYKIGYF